MANLRGGNLSNHPGSCDPTRFRCVCQGLPCAVVKTSGNQINVEAGSGMIGVIGGKEVFFAASNISNAIGKLLVFDSFCLSMPELDRLGPRNRLKNIWKIELMC